MRENALEIFIGLMLVGIIGVVVCGYFAGMPHEVFSRETECQVTPTNRERTVTRQGACLAWTKVGETQVCSMHDTYKVRQHANVVACHHDEWIDGSAGVE